MTFSVRFETFDTAPVFTFSPPVYELLKWIKSSTNAIIIIPTFCLKKVRRLFQDALFDSNEIVFTPVGRIKGRSGSRINKISGHPDQVRGIEVIQFGDHRVEIGIRRIGIQTNAGAGYLGRIVF